MFLVIVYFVDDLDICCKNEDDVHFVSIGGIVQFFKYLEKVKFTE